MYIYIYVFYIHLSQYHAVTSQASYPVADHPPPAATRSASADSDRRDRSGGNHLKRKRVLEDFTQQEFSRSYVSMYIYIYTYICIYSY